MEKSDSGSLNASESESTTRRRLGMVNAGEWRKIVAQLLSGHVGIRVKTLTPVSKTWKASIIMPIAYQPPRSHLSP